MFEPCWFWRRALSRRADSRLTPRQEFALEAHLTHCAACRLASEADDSLRQVLRVEKGGLSPAQAHAFDTRVVTIALAETNRLSPVRRRLRTCRRQVVTRWDALPHDFITQAAGGAILAASVTALFFLPALRPAATPHTAPSGSALTASDRNPPVPLDRLLNRPAPPATAQYWPNPATSLLDGRREGNIRTPRPAPRPATIRRAAPGSRHSGLSRAASRA